MESYAGRKDESVMSRLDNANVTHRGIACLDTSREPIFAAP
jgi:hypothetical protein